MNKKLRIRIMYLILLIELVLVGYIFFRDLKIVNSLSLTKIFELVMIISLIFLLIVIIKNVQKKFKKNRYSYKLITLIGLIIVVFINILRHSFILIFNWNLYNKFDMYKNILDSFSSFVLLTLPCIVILSIYSILANLVLIKKEGKKLRNILGIFIALLAILGLFSTQFLYNIFSHFITNDFKYYIRLISDVFINSTLVYFYSILLATLYCNIMAARYILKYDYYFRVYDKNRWNFNSLIKITS